MSKIKGIIFAIISAVSFGASPILISMTYEMGNNFMMMAFARNILMLPILYLYVSFKGISLKVSKEQFKKLSIMTIVGICFSLIALYLSYNYIPAALATSLHFIYPAIVAVLSVIFFKEELSKFRKLAVISSLIGVLLFIDLKSGSSNLFIGIALALFSGAAYAFYIIYMAKSGILRLPSLVILFYTCFISSIFLGILSAVTGHLVITGISLKGWGLIFLTSILLTFLGTFFTQLAIISIGTTVTSIMSTLEPITSIVLGVVIFKEEIGIIKLIACILILLAVLLLAIDQKHMAKVRSEDIEKYEDIINEQ